jgi:hypothetical protein
MEGRTGLMTAEPMNGFCSFLFVQPAQEGTLKVFFLIHAAWQSLLLSSSFFLPMSPERKLKALAGAKGECQTGFLTNGFSLSNPIRAPYSLHPLLSLSPVCDFQPSG